MSSTNLERFFAGNFFKVPSYQRDYAWTTDYVDELIEDIFEVIETNTNHYIGTFILSETGEQYLHVVDGQQRLTTLTILLRTVINNLDSEEDKIVYSRMFMKEKDSWRLELLNDNEFFKLLLEGENPQPETKSQHNLLSAYQHTKRRIEEMSQESVDAFLQAIRELEVMEFIESDYGRAIRIFQTVNDRGLPLSNIEKAKSLLVYYSNRFLSGRLDEYINVKFGVIFRLFNEIKTIGGLTNQEVKVINEKRFTEDTVMRYHLLAYDGFEDYYDYRATESDVLAVLKKAIKPLKSDSANLESFIRAYIDDLEAFFSSFQRIVSRISENEQYFKLFSLLEISASLYPLLIRLEARDMLSKEVETLQGLTFLNLLEIADVRVYKVRNTNPLKDITILAKDSNKISPRAIELRLSDFINNFMGNSEFRRALNAKMYTQALVPLINLLIVEYDEKLTGHRYSLEQMKEMNSKKPTVEHIFSQEERFDFPNFGFETHEEYAEERDKIGNLTLLEQGLNSKCKDRIPDDKWSYYDRSLFEDPKRISAHARNKGGFFKKEDIAERAEKLIPFVLHRWSIEE